MSPCMGTPTPDDSSIRQGRPAMYNNSFGPGGDPSLSHYTPSGQADKDITTTSQYDATGNVVATTDPLGHVTLTGYDVLNRPVKTIRSASQPTYNFQADPTLSHYVPSGQPDQDYVELSAYDNLGRVTRRQDSTGLWTLTGYDGLGRVVKTIRSASQPDYNTAADAALQFYPISDAPIG